MEINPESTNPNQEKYMDEAALPYLQEDKQPLPKNYDATIERLSAQLAQETSSNNIEGKALFGFGIAISLILMSIQLIALLGYPFGLDWLHHLLVLSEAALPFILSFFLKRPKHATLMRIIGIIVLIVYVITLF